MAKRYRIRDKILLGLALAGDIHSEVFEPVSLQWSKARGLLPQDYKVSNYYGSAQRMLKTDDIEKIIKDGESYMRLGKKGRGRLVREFSLFKFSQNKWDGYWRIVFYDIAEPERNSRIKLQKKLVELGFGKLQESVYVSPYDLVDDLREYLSESGLTNQVFVSASKRLIAGDERLLAEKIWEISKLNDDYKDWLGLLSDNKNKVELREIYDKYLEILSGDPSLPKELLPSDWFGFKARDKAKVIVGYLLNNK